MLAAGAIIGSTQAAADSIMEQRSGGLKVNFLTVGKEWLKGGIIGGISGYMGGTAAKHTKDLKFCDKKTIEKVGQVAKRWVSTAGADFGTGMVTTYVSNRLEGQSRQDAFANTMSSADDLALNAVREATSDAIGAARKAPKCFVAGTMITTAAGLVAIENISIGDMVLSEDPETGEITYKRVLDTFRNETDTVVHVRVNGEELITTEQHPFYVEGKGWVEASALHAGMVVWLADGTKVIIEDVWVEYLAEAVAVYNFKVDDFHTYFVGYSGVLVHNAPCGGAYKDTNVTSTEQRHHMPADSVSPFSTKKGPVIVMDTADHMQTASWGTSTAAKEYRAKQGDLISQGLFLEATEMDVADIRSKFGNKYDDAIDEMLTYTKKLLDGGK